MAAPFSILGIDHVVLRAANPAALERFYLDVLGLSFEKRQDKLVQLRAGQALLDIVPANGAGPAGVASGPAGANLDHLCLRVEPFEAAAITEHLAAQGVACGTADLRYGAEGKGPSIYLRDPEGNGVELKGALMTAQHDLDRRNDARFVTPLLLMAVILAMSILVYLTNVPGA
jgi:catechol-2,3-dioxygenase